MIPIRLIAMGHLKEPYLRTALAEYEKRLSRYCSFEMIELEPVRLNERPSEREIAAALDKESEKILAKIPAGTFTAALCIEGKKLSSEQFAEQIKTCADGGRPMTFIIGSSHGLSDAVKTRADLRVSFSAMTFPHQLFRVLLAEQIYRAFQINSGGEYHK